MASKNTEHALLHVINTISTALNENKYCIGLFLDFKKAFDSVTHDILLKKLEKTGNRWHSTGFLAISQIELKRLKLTAPSLIAKSSTYLPFKVHA